MPVAVAALGCCVVEVEVVEDAACFAFFSSSIFIIGPACIEPMLTQVNAETINRWVSFIGQNHSVLVERLQNTSSVVRNDRCSTALHVLKLITIKAMPVSRVELTGGKDSNVTQRRIGNLDG